MKTLILKESNKHFHSIGGNVHFYPMFPSVSNEGVRKVALITWRKDWSVCGYHQSYPSFQTKG